MADLVSYGNADRDIEQALVALKKGSQLLKYGRKGKPKFCPFRLSHDETSLIWISSSGEKNLKLSSVSRIVPGQRTAVFQRYLRPEKDYLSFSLIYSNGKRSLDLICKDKVEAEVWIAGLKALISHGHGGRSKIDGWNDGGLYLEDNRDLTSNRTSESSSVNLMRHSSSPEISVSSSNTNNTSPNNIPPHVPSQTNMQQVKGSASDTFRVSVSSAPSTSSHGDDCDISGDVYIWGEVICDQNTNNNNSLSTRTDIVLPKPLESNVVLDAYQIACGVRHMALTTRQGEVFTWGEESGGRLGHGVIKDITHPRLVESLAATNVDSVSCGEFHTCAITASGDLYTWGDGAHYAGLLGHGTEISHWVPKRIMGSIEGLQIAYVTCGPWHTALLTSAGRLFTFGDGTFGVLGHGDRGSSWIPREVESLKGLRTIAVACGVWHTAAIVEVIVTQSSGGKLFTWGDGDKNRLGQGDKEARLEPTCVPALIDYNFQKIACGHSLTVGLTTLGHVFTMGSTVYGQLGNPNSDGKLPCMVEDNLGTELVEEITCGAYHVSVLTSKNEVYTWGKGANGRLGHGDTEDRKTPVLVEALKDRHVKFIACGSNYTAAICLHKWICGSEQSQCSSCKQAFGFTRKRHNCYNCGLVLCHSCSSKRAFRAALAPNPSKPYRVCDSCFVKLSKMPEGNNHNRRNSVPRISGENRDRLDKAEIRLAKSGVPSSNLDLIKQLDDKAAKQVKKSVQAPPSQLKDTLLTNSGDPGNTIIRPVVPKAGVSSRSVSPFTRRLSPPRSVTPVPTTSGLSLSKSAADSLKKTNELLNQEVLKLRREVESLRQKCEVQEVELEKLTKKTQEAMALAEEESSKSRAAKEVIKSLTAQLKDIAERFPPGVYDFDSLRLANPPDGLKPNGNHYPVTNEDLSHSRSDSINSSYFNSPPITDLTSVNGTNGPTDQVSSCTSDENRVQVGPKESSISQDTENSTNPRNSGDQVDTEWIEQYEPGVYITLVALQDGTRDLKRVRFSRRRFGEHQAETWWSENRDKVYEKYNVRGSDRSSSVTSQPARLSGGAVSQISQRY